MSSVLRDHQLELPEGIRKKLDAFRKRVWFVKTIEGAFAAVFGLLLSFLFLFILDRFYDTPILARTMLLLGGASGLGLFFPLKCHRWIWRQRRLEQVARLLKFKFPRLGDQLLGIVELAESEAEQHRSSTLVCAAMQQVDEATKDREFLDAVPHPRHRRWALIAGVTLLPTIIILCAVPTAGTNALARWLMPWRNIERFTFAELKDLPDTIVVPFAEKYELKAELAASTRWAPQKGSAQLNHQTSLQVEQNEGSYRFSLPPQRDPGELFISIGDARKKINVQPMTRPELKSMTARVTLPEYLQRRETVIHDVRGGGVSLVKGSHVIITAQATRELSSMKLNGFPQTVKGKKVVTKPLEIQKSVDNEFTWQDKYGLTSKQPFVLKVQSRDDEAPSLLCENLSDGQVLLDEEFLKFDVIAADDYGIKTIGMEWKGVPDPLQFRPLVRGEKVVAAGGADREELHARIAFSAKREGIDPQVILLRIFTEDYFPGRERIYSPTYTMYVLNAEDHAIWLTEQLRKWFQKSQEVYEQEQRLFTLNQTLRDLSLEERNKSDTRSRIEKQAAAERANGRRLLTLTGAGSKLLSQATKNDQFNVLTLETWAEMLQKLKDIAANRMPSVAELLDDVTSPPRDGPLKEGIASKLQDNSPPQVGRNRGRNSGGGRQAKPGVPNKTPSITDIESGFNEIDDKKKKEDEKDSKSGPQPLKLPTTIVQGGGAKQEDDVQDAPPSPQMDEAVEEQEDLLAEFEKVVEELKKILGNLEGSTFVKRLKHASRNQLEIAGDLNSTLRGSFGISESQVTETQRKRAQLIGKREIAQSEKVYNIQEDLQAYFNRVQQGKFKGVLDEMKSVRVVGELEKVADTVTANFKGQSIADTERLADMLDRWAEQLVGPG